MPDTSAAATGKDMSVTITWNGAVQGIAEKVKVRVQKLITELTTSPLGQATDNIDTLFAGWQIELDVDISRPDGADLVTLITTGELLRVPGLLALSTTTKFRNTAKQGFMYPDIKLVRYDENWARKEKATAKFTFKTGLDRVDIS